MKRILPIITLFIFLTGCTAEMPLDTESTTPVPTATPTPSIALPQDWVELKTEPYDLTNMRLAWCSEIDLKGNGTSQFVSLYVNAARMADGSFAFDDGQDWALLVESDDGVYPLFDRDYVQLGTLSCSIFKDMNDESLHILAKKSQGAGMEMFDFSYNPEHDEFLRELIYYVSNISYLGGSEELPKWFYNPKVDSYKNALSALPLKDKAEVTTAFELLQPMMARGEILPNEAVDAFLDFHYLLINSIDLGVDFEALGYTITPELQAEYALYFMRLFQSEGYLFATTDLVGIASALSGHVDWDYQQYFELAQWLRDEGFEQLVSDAGLTVSWNELADVIAKYQQFETDHAELAQRRELSNSLDFYLNCYLESILDNSPTRDKNGKLLPEVKASYEYFMETYPNSPLYSDVHAAYIIDKIQGRT